MRNPFQVFNGTAAWSSGSNPAALACLNRSFDVILESLKVLQEEGVLKADYLHDQNIFVEELRRA